MIGAPNMCEHLTQAKMIIRTPPRNDVPPQLNNSFDARVISVPLDGTTEYGFEWTVDGPHELLLTDTRISPLGAHKRYDASCALEPFGFSAARILTQPQP